MVIPAHAERIPRANLVSFGLVNSHCGSSLPSDMSMMSLIGTPGFGAVVVGVMTFIAKNYMSCTVRMQPFKMNPEELKKYMASEEVNFIQRTQLSNGLETEPARAL